MKNSRQDTNKPIKQKGITLSVEVDEQLEDGYQKWLERQGPKANKKKWVYIDMILARGLQHTDSETGEEKVPATPSNAYRISLPVFGCDYFAEDAELFRAMNASGLMLWAATPDNACLHVTPFLVDWTGCSVAEFQNDGWIALVHPDDRESLVTSNREYFRTRRPFTNTYRLRRKDGTYYPFIDYAQPRFLPDGTFIGYVGNLSYLPPGTNAVYLYEAPRDQSLAALSNGSRYGLSRYS